MAKYLKRAQEGMEADSGASQEQMLDAYYQYAYGQLMNDVAPEKVYGELVSNGLPNQIANQMINKLVDYLVDEGQLNPDYGRAKESEEGEEEGGEEQAQGQPATQEIEEDWNENYGPSANQEQEDQSMYEEDQDMADMEENYLQDRSYMQDGGTQDEEEEESYDTESDYVVSQYDDVTTNEDEKPFNFQEIIQNTPGIQEGLKFPSISEYIPDYQELEWVPMDALQAPESSESEYEQRKGGAIKKKQFVKNVMSLLKKQEGGEEQEEQQEEDPNRPLGKGNRMDTLTEDVQKHKNNFLSAVKDKATKVKTEEMYDKLMKSSDPSMQQLGMKMQGQFQTGGMTGGEDPLFRFIGGGTEDPNFYEADFLPEAQMGMFTPKLFQRLRETKEYVDKQKPQDTKTNIPKATIKYVPNYRTVPGSLLRNLLPWNPIMQRSRQYVQTGSPYYMGTRTPYMDPLAGKTPIARQVHKKGIFGRPKSWTDIYSLDGKLPDNTEVIHTKDKINQPSKTSNDKKKVVDPNMPQRTDTKNMSAKAQRDIRQGEREAMANYRRVRRDPELLKYLSELEDNYRKRPVPTLSTKRPESNLGYLAGEPIQLDLNNTPTPQNNYENMQMDPRLWNEEYLNPVVFDTTEMAYGGYMPKANNGITINNPNLPQPGPANPDLALGERPGLVGPLTPPANSFDSVVSAFQGAPPVNTAAQAYNSNPANNIPMEPQGEDLSQCTPQQKNDSASKCYCSPEAKKDPKNKRCFEGGNLIGVDVNTAKSTTVDPEAGINVLNAGIRGITGLMDRKDQKRKEAQMYQNMQSQNLYASQTRKHRGDWVDTGSMAGQYRFDQQGQDRSGFSSYGKYGGYMQDGGENAYNEGDEVYMTDEDIRNFMEQGGQIEYI